jgi:uncharacterized protein
MSCRLLRLCLLPAASIGWVLLTSAVVAAQSPDATQSSAAQEQTSVKALMITGGCCHDYQNQKQIISEGLSKRVGGIEWTILHYGEGKDVKADVYKNSDWINGFDIVVHNECFGAVEDTAFINGIVDAHTRTGIPAIMIHCSLHSYRTATNADAWRELVGVTSRRHEKMNRRLDVVATEAGTSHEVLAKSSLLASGKTWKTPNGELYIIENVWPGTTVLATALSVETHQNEPVIWINETNGVRVFGTSLGHHNETMLDDVWQEVVASGFRWAMQKP